MQSGQQRSYYIRGIDSSNRRLIGTLTSTAFNIINEELTTNNSIVSMTANTTVKASFIFL